tara:strand:- start:4883 stop:5362 length:480 start_codon:yes stop_codon:yes gene_type:complete
MNKRGQIISLDFLISVAAITLAIGLLIQFNELKVYNENEELKWLELKEVAETAGDMLVSHPDTTCTVNAGSYFFKLLNCIDTQTIDTGTKTKLGIPNEFDFSTVIDGTDIGGTISGQDYYAVQRTIVFNSGPLTKREFNEGTFDSGSSPVQVTLMVWKI